MKLRAKIENMSNRQFCTNFGNLIVAEAVTVFDVCKGKGDLKMLSSPEAFVMISLRDYDNVSKATSTSAKTVGILWTVTFSCGQRDLWKIFGPLNCQLCPYHHTGQDDWDQCTSTVCEKVDWETLLDGLINVQWQDQQLVDAWHLCNEKETECRPIKLVRTEIIAFAGSENRT